MTIYVKMLAPRKQTNEESNKKSNPQLSATIMYFDRAHHLPRNDNRQNVYDTLERSHGSGESTRHWENLP